MNATEFNAIEEESDEEDSKLPAEDMDNDAGLEVNNTEAKKNAAHPADLRRSLSSSGARKTPPGTKGSGSKASPSAKRDTGKNKKSSQFQVRWAVNHAATSRSETIPEYDEDSVGANDDYVDWSDEDDYDTPGANWPAFEGSPKDYWDDPSSSDEEDLFH